MAWGSSVSIASYTYGGLSSTTVPTTLERTKSKKLSGLRWCRNSISPSYRVFFFKNIFYLLKLKGNKNKINVAYSAQDKHRQLGLVKVRAGLSSNLVIGRHADPANVFDAPYEEIFLRIIPNC